MTTKERKSWRKIRNSVWKRILSQDLKGLIETAFEEYGHSWNDQSGPYEYKTSRFAIRVLSYRLNKLGIISGSLII
jgi:hypothetical protein